MKPQTTSVVPNSTKDSVDLEQAVIIVPPNNILKGKDNFVWQTKINKKHGKTHSKNIIHISPGPTAIARQANKPLECFKLFFTPDIVNKVVLVTHMN